MKMDQFLAEHYGTNKTASAAAEDLEKEATVQLFMKVAEQQNIDLKSMKDEQVNQLFAQFEANLAKQAAAAPDAPAAGGEQKKTAAAAPAAQAQADLAKQAEAELAQKHAAQEKIAEAEFLGRVMAHSMVQELRKIASDSKEEEEKERKAKEEKEKHKEAEMPEALRKGLEHVRGGGDDKDGKKEEKHEPPKHEDKDEEKKATAAIDALAREHAVKMAHAANIDPVEAGKKIAAVILLDQVKPSTKIAAAKTVEQAVEIRALEMLEAAGYPVTWT